jgi:putative restriction endonuclease
VHVREDILREHDGPMLRYGLQTLDGQLITVPRSALLRPRKEYLEVRFGEFRAA